MKREHVMHDPKCVLAVLLKKPRWPEDLAGTAVFLASEDSAMMRGQVRVVDAGMIMLG